MEDIKIQELENIYNVYKGDVEVLHVMIDTLMTDLLKELGYVKLVEKINELLGDCWYS